ncbi:MAG: CRISPR system precrRNA processing endoribonuclease RAMP protein Cas6 [Deltaproteobacteria bacterium]|nr:CRISPR system precrRNA processing endoribonuclease RAMP protein Cas6 [Deltaproteobacteria bacterium]
MLFGDYSFFCLLENEAFLPYYKGSTFRGVFGTALKRVVCALRREECKDCILRERCLYSQVFETPSSRPHPFVIEPPLSTDTHFEGGSPFNFSLLLFGEANKNLPYFIYAFEQMGKIGIGKRVGGKRGRFAVESVKIGDELVYDGNEGKIIMKDPTQLSLNHGKEKTQKGISRLRLILITPLRLKFHNRLTAELPFHVLVRAMLRRVSSLYNAFCEGEPDLDYKGLVHRAQSVKVVRSEIDWFDWQRYSGRQDRSMLMGGIVGSITYEGEIGEYMPLLDFCARVHLGKQTSFGLGMVRWEAI